MLKLRTEKGFTLIELMIVVAIIGILAAIAVPNFIAYRNKSRVAAAVATTESIRGAMAGLAAVSRGNTFPTVTEITGWDTLVPRCNIHGATLDADLLTQGFTSFTYTALDSDGSEGCTNTPGAECADYVMIFVVAGVPGDLQGVQIEVRPSGIWRQTLGGI